MSNKNNIVKYRNSFNFNIGFVVFFIIIVYVLFNIFSYFTKSHIAEYRVQQGTIASNNVFQGVILRDETVEYSPYSGYVNYYQKNASKVSVTDIVYSIDTVGTIYKELSAVGGSNQTLSPESIGAISKEIDTFINEYNSNQFSNSYSFFNNLDSEIKHNINSNALVNLSSKVSAAEQNQTFYKITSPDDGIIVYEMDGFEEYSIEDVTSSDVNFNSYKKTHLTSNREIKASDPVYKRINSEEWNIIIPITESLAKEFNEKSFIKIRFCKDNFTTNAACSLLKEEGQYYLDLSLKTGMIRYITDRFIDVELVMSDNAGLKIPKSAITSKEFFTIPKEYFTVGGDSTNPGLLIKQTIDGVDSVQLISPTLYFETEEYYYIDNEKVSEGDVVLMSDSASTYTVGSDKASLIGVYNINKGYAIFKQINIIFENEEYAIVETKTAYGISLYDHIALDASQVKENQLTAE